MLEYAINFKLADANPSTAAVEKYIYLFSLGIDHLKPGFLIEQSLQSSHSCIPELLKQERNFFLIPYR